MKKIFRLIITIVLCLGVFSINAYATDSITNKLPQATTESTYITYRNAIQVQMSKILSNTSLGDSDVSVLQALNRINMTANDKLTLLDDEYKKLNDYRIISIKSDLSVEIANGYDFTYINPIEKQISDILLKETGDIKKELKEYIIEINRINSENANNTEKIVKLNELLKKYDNKNNINPIYSEIKQRTQSVIEQIENEAAIPPRVDELPVKTLIIGQYIIYMPSLTTDNLLCAKNTLPDDGKMYYKSEFIGGKWIEMNDVSELYDLMIENSYKIVSDTSLLEKIEYIAQIDKEENLIEYRKFKQYMNSINNQSEEKSDDELANSLDEQLSAIENSYLDDSLSNMFAESRTAESKLDALNDLYDETKDSRVIDTINSLKAEIASGKVDKYDNAIKDTVDKLKAEATGTDKDNSLIEKLEKINGVPQSVKDERELQAQLVDALNKNDKQTADTIKLLLGLPVEDNTTDLNNLADELRSEGLTNLADMVQAQTFSDEVVSSIKPFDEQLEKLVAATVLLSTDKNKIIANIKDEKLQQAINNNIDKNNTILQNLKDACFNTIKTQCDTLIKDKEKQTKQLKDLNSNKNNLVKQLDTAIKNNDTKSIADIYAKVVETQNQIDDLNKKIDDTNKAINNLSDKINKYCDIIDLSDLLKIKSEIDAIKENNKDYMLDIVELMIQRYQLIEEYKVELSKGLVLSMSKLRDEIAKRDYKINYILSLNILDKNLVDINYNIRLADILHNTSMKNTYLAKLKAYNVNIDKADSYNKEVIEKAQKLLNNK